MEGAECAERRRMEHEIALAYNIMVIDRDNQKGSLKPLSKYLKAVREDIGPQTADDVAGVFLALKAKGRAVKIRERPKKLKV